MKMYTYYKKITFILLIITGCKVYAQETASKKIEKEYAFINAGKIYLENKYGDITINGWEKDSLYIIINVVSSHKKKDNAVNLLQRVEFDIDKAGDFISIQSEISDKNLSFFAKHFNKVNPFDFDKSNLQIDYTVFLPEYTEINIQNKFGDIIITDWKGELEAKLEHGDIWINDEINTVNLEMKFGKLRAKWIKYSHLDIKNGNVDIEQSENLRIKSSGSDFNIENVDKMELYSSKDEIKIMNAGNISGNIDFSDVLIENISDQVDLTMNLADLAVYHVINKDAVVKIEQESSNISINITGLAFKFSAMMEQGLIRIPKSFSDIKTEIIDESKKVRTINARYGINPSGLFEISGKKGAVILKE
ncbi:hypothetical protein [Abyssalbus ytuae]|uniref:Adhesin domain-containing protein n=1 Tax=Abyssalbus ytuae TaxID=2926907 RepID=A0A9E6ZXZ2_9FLAO|nr:hypothetical protein [Abyssalbus ytuae]UOB17242.1 hypothetical protein MQE35_16085 [Abyssalbus ytuae]